MTDRELLELAAKASEIAVEYDEASGLFWLGDKFTGLWWNPLHHDGDALRLAAKLHLWEAVRLAHREVSDTMDIYAATRRAIVRAAAEIGKELK